MGKSNMANCNGGLSQNNIIIIIIEAILIIKVYLLDKVYYKNRQDYTKGIS